MVRVSSYQENYRWEKKEWIGTTIDEKHYRKRMIDLTIQ